MSHSTAPEKGMYQDFYINMAALPAGLAVLDVQHDFQIVSVRSMTRFLPL